jgi:hypothetical protein
MLEALLLLLLLLLCGWFVGQHAFGGGGLQRTCWTAASKAVAAGQCCQQQPCSAGSFDSRHAGVAAHGTGAVNADADVHESTRDDPLADTTARHGSPAVKTPSVTQRRADSERNMWHLLATTSTLSVKQITTWLGPITCCMFINQLVAKAGC